jgi:hypothetical protein
MSATDPSSPPDASGDAELLDRDGRERPAFLRGLPPDAQLTELARAFERGDFREVRRRAEHVIAHAESARVRDAAREIRRRIDPDPLVRWLILVTAALLVFLVLWTYGHAH